MKKLIPFYGALLTAGLLFVVGCKEDLPLVNLVEPEKPLIDTVYQGTSVTQEPKNVLLFDITGVRCVNCPTAAQVAKDIVNANPKGRVNVLALYPFYQPSNTKPWEGYDTLNTLDAEYLGSQFGAPVGMPMGMIDQINYNSNRLLAYPLWAGIVTSQQNVASNFNIDLKTSWNTTTKKGRVEIKNIYTGAASSKKYLMYLAITESKIIGKQKDLSTTGHKDDYEHNHVLRKIITRQTGDTLQNLTASYITFEKHFSITPSLKWKPENLHCLVWIVDMDTRDVIQSKEIELIP